MCKLFANYFEMDRKHRFANCLRTICLSAEIGSVEAHAQHNLSLHGKAIGRLGTMRGLSDKRNGRRLSVKQIGRTHLTIRPAKLDGGLGGELNRAAQGEKMRMKYTLFMYGILMYFM